MSLYKGSGRRDAPPSPPGHSCVQVIRGTYTCPRSKLTRILVVSSSRGQGAYQNSGTDRTALIALHVDALTKRSDQNRHILIGGLCYDFCCASHGAEKCAY